MSRIEPDVSHVLKHAVDDRRLWTSYAGTRSGLNFDDHSPCEFITQTESISLYRADVALWSWRGTQRQFVSFESGTNATNWRCRRGGHVLLRCPVVLIYAIHDREALPRSSLLYCPMTPLYDNISGCFVRFIHPGTVRIADCRRQCYYRPEGYVGKHRLQLLCAVSCRSSGHQIENSVGPQSISVKSANRSSA